MTSVELKAVNYKKRIHDGYDVFEFIKNMSRIYHQLKSIAESTSKVDFDKGLVTDRWVRDFDNEVNIICAELLSYIRDEYTNKFNGKYFVRIDQYNGHNVHAALHVTGVEKTFISNRLHEYNKFEFIPIGQYVSIDSTDNHKVIRQKYLEIRDAFDEVPAKVSSSVMFDYETYGNEIDGWKEITKEQWDDIVNIDQDGNMSINLKKFPEV